MRSLAIGCALFALWTVATSNNADASEPKTVSRHAMHAMGFGSARVMTDHEGDAVRGKGYLATVRGFASAGGTTTTFLKSAPPGNTVS